MEQNMATEKNEPQNLTLNEIYREIGTNYRFFLNWRHALFAGYLLILYTLANAYAWLYVNDQAQLYPALFIIGFLITLCFWGIEFRIRSLYRSCTEAGHGIETLAKITGAYTKLDDSKLEDKRVTHSSVLNWFFGAIAFGMLIGVYISLWQIFN
jgi:hypothetical protein